MEPETEREFTRRRYQRTLFDRVAQLYDDSRLSYPAELVGSAVATAGAGAGSDVLEVGCGTGQLTEGLVRYAFRLTAIDIGTSMIAAARRRLEGSAVSLQVVSFEEFAAAEASYDLIVSGTAFHWVDPEVKFRKTARLLRPGGWLALLETGERYDDPLGAALRGMWAARTGVASGRVQGPHAANSEVVGSTGLFERPIRKTHTQRIVSSPETVVAVENTRATSLSWPADAREEFTAELRRQLQAETEVQLTQQTTLTMARALPSSEDRGARSNGLQT
jgi:ubiquinone/menaquinone biosynthesis C-methylase UbiE